MRHNAPPDQVLFGAPIACDWYPDAVIDFVKSREGQYYSSWRGGNDDAWVSFFLHPSYYKKEGWLENDYGNNLLAGAPWFDPEACGSACLLRLYEKSGDLPGLGRISVEDAMTAEWRFRVAFWDTHLGDLKEAHRYREVASLHAQRVRAEWARFEKLHASDPTRRLVQGERIALVIAKRSSWYFRDLADVIAWPHLLHHLKKSGAGVEPVTD